MSVMERNGRWGFNVYRSRKHGGDGKRTTMSGWDSAAEAAAAEADYKRGLHVVAPVRISLPEIDNRPVVYFVSAPSLGLVKIGFTTGLMRRFKDLDQGSPVPLVLLGHIDGPVEREKEMHVRFRLYRVRNEWFRLAGGLEDFLMHELRDEQGAVRYVATELKVVA